MTREKSCQEIKLITKIISLGLLSSMSLSYDLWTTSRNFPLSPVFTFLKPIPYPFDIVLIGILFLLLIGILLLRNPQKLIIVFTLIAIAMALFDINRWQPWFYQYLCMFFVLSFFNYRCDDIKQQNAIVSIFRLMIVSVYFWSGLQKLNPHFISDTFPWLMEPFRIQNINDYTTLGKSFPVIETISGILLLINDTKKFAVIIVACMHLLILFIIGPFGHNYNPVVWTWNLAMIGFCFILFYNERRTSIEDIRIMFRFHSIKIIFLLFCLAPQLNFFNMWDSYLSHNLYSGNTSKGVLVFSDSVKKELPTSISKYAVGEDNNNMIDIKNWGMQEMGVPAFPEKRNFERVREYVSGLTSIKNEIYLDFTDKLSIRDLLKK